MHAILEKLHLSGEQAGAGSGTWLECAGLSAALTTPVTGEEIGRIRCATRDEYEKVVRRACEAFAIWRDVPAPRRGEIVRQMGQALRERKDDLAALVSLETGKIREEGAGEIQEMIDIADFAVGQSRMLYGLSLHSERPRHRMFEQWHPLGPVGVVTAFNFPAAVWAWNAMLALVAGDTVIWKPSSKAALTAVAVMQTVWPVLAANGLPEGILNLVVGPRDDIGEALLHDPRVPLISATGSVAMGRHVAQVVAARLGRSLLELGGNNGVIVTPRADLPMAVRAIVFGAVGTAGQRCTSVRRLIAHEGVYDRLVGELSRVYARIPVGNPLEEGVLMGPLIDRGAVAAMQAALEKLAAQGGRVLYGGEVLRGGLFDAGTYVRPCLAEATAAMPIVSEETFAPILYVMRYRELEEAIAWHNAVPQGLSSAIFSDDLRETERFLSAAGSDCGIANVNIGTSGAEIGGAFGGEKDTGGGRESGSDAWKAYMRRQTCTVNWSGELPLAQGIRFELD